MPFKDIKTPERSLPYSTPDLLPRHSPGTFARSAPTAGPVATQILESLRSGATRRLLADHGLHGSRAAERLIDVREIVRRRDLANTARGLLGFEDPED